MSSAHGGEKKSDPLELQVVMNHHVDSGNWNLDPLQERQVLFTTKPSQQPPGVGFLSRSPPLSDQQQSVTCRHTGGPGPCQVLKTSHLDRKIGL